MAAVPERDAEYGERVWEALRPRLIPYEKAVGWHRFFGKSWVQWRIAALAVGCAALVAAAFFGGRIWERHQKSNYDCDKCGNAGEAARGAGGADGSSGPDGAAAGGAGARGFFGP